MVWGKDKQRCCTNGCGVQMMGCSWCFAITTSVFFLVFGSIMYTSTYVMLQVSSIGADMPTHFVEFFNGTTLCNGAVPSSLPEKPDMGDMANVCYVVGDMLSSCANNEYIFDGLFEAFGFNYTVAKFDDQLVAWQTELTDVANDLVTSPVLVEAKLLASNLSSASDQLADSSYTPSSSAEQVAYAALSQSVSAVTSEAVSVLDCVWGVGGDSGGVVGETVNLAFNVYDTVYVSWQAVLAAADCGWWTSSWQKIVDAVDYVIQAPYALSLIGFLVMASLSVVAYTPSAIAMQIIHGGVGEEPGCPRFCRCCCRGAGKGRVYPSASVDV